jgi:hypothetical protein
MTGKGSALSVVVRVAMMPGFIENPKVQQAVTESVPVSMPSDPGSLGFDIPFWAGLGLEQIPSGLNREGFPNRLGCDSSCMLVKEAGMHGPSPIVGSSQTRY